MNEIIEKLSDREKESIRMALKFIVEGDIIEDWEFHPLMGIDRGTAQNILNDWPEQKVANNEFICAIMNSLANLIGYPHGQHAELSNIIPGGTDELERIADKLIKLGF